MPKTKEKHQTISVYPVENWSVANEGIELFINHSQPPLFLDGAALDVEDDEKGNFVGLGIYGQEVMGGGWACYYWGDFDIVKHIIIPKFIAHNGASDIEKLRKWGFPVMDEHLLWDTMLTEYVLDSSKHSYGLKALILEHFGKQYPSYDDIVGKKTEKQKKPRITLDKQPVELVAEYNACDCYWTYRLYEHQKQRVKDREIRYATEIEKPVSFVFKAMEERGIKVDLPYLKELKGQLEAQRRPLEVSIKAELGEINLNSPPQLLKALQAKGFNPRNRKGPSTDKAAIDGLPDGPIKANLKAYGEVDTLLTVFVDKYLERGEEVGQRDGTFVVHPHFNQTGTRTGRLSCSNPNLLQIPKRTDNGKCVRRMFIAREGMLLGDCDYGQIEPRILAHLSQDPNMCQMFNEGTDFHSFTAEKLGISRDRAKILNLSVGYRATPQSVSQQLKCSWEQAQTEIDKWWSLFPTLYDWQQKLIYESRKSGYCTTLMGRRIKVDELNTPNQWRREGAERQLINNITQGSAAEVMKKGMVAVSRENIDILVQVYDELVIECPEESISSDIEIVVDKLITTTMLSIPLTVDSKIGKNWGDLK